MYIIYICIIYAYAYTYIYVRDVCIYTCVYMYRSKRSYKNIQLVNYSSFSEINV